MEASFVAEFAPGCTDEGTVIFQHPSGAQHLATFEVRDEMIRVSYGGATKTTQVGSMEPLRLAQMLFREMIGEAA